MFCIFDVDDILSAVSAARCLRSAVMWLLTNAAVGFPRTSVLHKRIGGIEDDADQQQSGNIEQDALQDQHDQQQINQIHMITPLFLLVMLLIIPESADYARDLNHSHNFAKSALFFEGWRDFVV